MVVDKLRAEVTHLTLCNAEAEEYDTVCMWEDLRRNSRNRRMGQRWYIRNHHVVSVMHDGDLVLFEGDRYVYVRGWTDDDRQGRDLVTGYVKLHHLHVDEAWGSTEATRPAIQNGDARLRVRSRSRSQRRT